jgi:RNA polymerase sigma-70 factor (ECF subfamily)
VAIASDEALVAGMAAGDTEAARDLIRRYQARVYGLAVAIVGDRQVAEDVAQEAFVRLWRHAGAFDPRRARVATWLLTITRNAAIDARRVRRDTPVDPEAFATIERATEPAPEALAVHASEVVRVRQALGELPTDQRRALVLAAFFGRTANEVAELEHIPLGTAKTRIRTGLRRARTALALDDAGADDGRGEP